MREMRGRFGTRFILVINDATLLSVCRSWCEERDRIVVLADLERQSQEAALDAETVFSRAQGFEQSLGIVYLRDIIQQHRAVSAYYLQYAPNSAWSTRPNRDLVSLYGEINFFADYFQALFREEGVDLVIERPGGLASTICLHAAMAAGIATTFSLPSRFRSYVMWSLGPYLSWGLLERAYHSVEKVPIPREELQPPDDSAQNIARARALRSARTLLANVARATINHLIWAWQDLRRFKRGRRLPYWRIIRNHLATYRTYRFLEGAGISDFDELGRQPFVLFLLQLEPEFTTLSLAREFNNTKAIVQQLALSLPAGYRLVLKEHVTAIGNRALSFYQDLLRLPNVVMADYRLRGLDLASRSAAVSTISGTVAMEAALLGKQAIIFAEHVEYGFLPSVHLVTAPRDLPKIVREAVAPRGPQEIEEVRIAGARYREALKSISFSAPGTRIFRGSSPAILPAELARAVDLLVASYRAQQPVG